MGSCFNWGSAPRTDRLCQGQGPPLSWGLGLTATQVPVWADLLVDWTTMAWSFFSCSKRDLSGNGRILAQPHGAVM